MQELKGLKLGLEESKNDSEQKRRELINYDQELTEQDRALEITKDEKSSLLTQTKS